MVCHYAFFGAAFEKTAALDVAILLMVRARRLLRAAVFYTAGAPCARCDNAWAGIRRPSYRAPRTMNGAVAMAAGAVVIYFSRLGTPMLTHERVTLSAVAKAIAQIKDYEFADCYDNPANYSGTVFFVPDDTLMLDEASCLGIGCPNDLFGGVVPYPIAQTKAI